MKFKAPSAVGAVLVAGALAFPVRAGAHIQTGVSSVRAHTDRADAALDRAVALFERNRDRRAKQSFNRSRREMGQATAEAAHLRRAAGSAPARAAAARALALVAGQQDESVDQLRGLLDEVEGRLKSCSSRAFPARRSLGGTRRSRRFANSATVRSAGGSWAGFRSAFRSASRRVRPPHPSEMSASPVHRSGASVL